MKLLPLIFIFFIFSTGCTTLNSQKNHETSECLRFKSLMTDLLEPAALYALQEACINSKAKNH